VDRRPLVIDTQAEYQRVQELTAVLTDALRLLGARNLHLDPDWYGFLRDAYTDQLAGLGREMRRFERTHGVVPPPRALLQDEVRAADRRIQEARRDMFLLRERMQDLDPSTLQDCDRLALMNAQLNAHEDLLGEWLAYKAQLLITLASTGIRLHVSARPTKNRPAR
jgi:hypothetical protein